MHLYEFTRRKGLKGSTEDCCRVSLASVMWLSNFRSMSSLNHGPVSSAQPKGTKRLWGADGLCLSTPGDQNGLDEISPGIILTCSSSAKMIASVLTYPHEVLRTRLQMQPRVAAGAINPIVSVHNQRAMHTTILGKSRQNGGGKSTQARPYAASIFASDRRRRAISHLGNVNAGNRYTGVIQACQTIAREEGLRGFYRGMGVNLIRTVPSSALTILTCVQGVHDWPLCCGDAYFSLFPSSPTATRSCCIT
jgi:hypothetical protein